MQSPVFPRSEINNLLMSQIGDATSLNDATNRSLTVNYPIFEKKRGLCSNIKNCEVLKRNMLLSQRSTNKRCPLHVFRSKNYEAYKN